MSSNAVRTSGLSREDDGARCGPAGLRSRFLAAARGCGRRDATATINYNPAAKLDIKVSEVEFRRNTAGRMLMARIYQPAGCGTVSHRARSAWRRVERQGPPRRRADGPRDGGERRARGRHRYDAARRKRPTRRACRTPTTRCAGSRRKRATWNGDPSKIGIYGSSSGGHVAELLAMRPRDPRYNAIPLPERRRVSTRPSPTSRCVRRSATRGRATRTRSIYKRDDMVKNNTTFFNPWDTIHESNPQRDPPASRAGHAGAAAGHAGRARRQRATGRLQKKFAETYKAAGGDIRYELFEGCEHEWVAKEGRRPTGRARWSRLLSRDSSNPDGPDHRGRVAEADGTVADLDPGRNVLRRRGVAECLRRSRTRRSERAARRRDLDMLARSA